MRKFLIIFQLLSTAAFAQHTYTIETADIDNFWKACDRLESAGTKADSIRIIQTEYIDKATPYFREFIRLRNFKASEYVALLGRYPKFWKSIRPHTERIASRKPEIEAVFENYRKNLPGFKQPNVCFAIGCLRTGGTTGRSLILIGADIAAADSTVEKSELSPWLKSVIGNTGDIVSMIAHETVHTQQRNRVKRTLLNACLAEGVADFIAMQLTGLTINAPAYTYGNAYECSLWKEFEKDLSDSPRDVSRWLYQGNRTEGRPADLGYFIGFKISEAYFQKQTDKQKALRMLLNRRKYGKVYRKSGYGEERCE